MSEIHNNPIQNSPLNENQRILEKKNEKYLKKY